MSIYIKKKLVEIEDDMYVYYLSRYKDRDILIRFRSDINNLDISQYKEENIYPRKLTTIKEYEDVKINDILDLIKFIKVDQEISDDVFVQIRFSIMDSEEILFSFLVILFLNNGKLITYRDREVGFNEALFVSYKDNYIIYVSIYVSIFNKRGIEATYKRCPIIFSIIEPTKLPMYSIHVMRRSMGIGIQNLLETSTHIEVLDV